MTSNERLCICSDPENCIERVPGYRCKKDVMPQAVGPCKGVQSHDWKMFCQCCGCPYPGVVMGDHQAPTMTPFETSGIPWQEKAEKRADKIHELRASLGLILNMSVTVGYDAGHAGIEAECRKALDITPEKRPGTKVSVGKRV